MRTGIPWKYPGLREGSEQGNRKAWPVLEFWPSCSETTKDICRKALSLASCLP